MWYASVKPVCLYNGIKEFLQAKETLYIILKTQNMSKKLFVFVDNITMFFCRVWMARWSGTVPVKRSGIP